MRWGQAGSMRGRDEKYTQDISGINGRMILKRIVK
jgi:hypothetical protein